MKLAQYILLIAITSILLTTIGSVLYSFTTGSIIGILSFFLMIFSLFFPVIVGRIKSRKDGDENDRIQ